MHRLRWLLVFFVAVSACGQTFRGTLTGNVTDVQGAALTDVKVVLTNPATGTTLNSTVTSSGDFTFPELPDRKSVV